MKKIALILSLVLMLAACGAQPAETTPAPAQPDETTPATPAETTPADTEKDGGCGSAALPLATLGVATAAGAVIAKKKKKIK